MKPMTAAWQLASQAPKGARLKAGADLAKIAAVDTWKGLGPAWKALKPAEQDLLKRAGTYAALFGGGYYTNKVLNT